MEVILNILREMWAILGEMSVYLLFGFLIAGILSILISPETVERHLGGKGIWPVIKATLFGVPLPLCSCGVIPVATSLRKHGATKGATTAFLLSTPQTGIDSILVTYSLLGMVFAIFRPIVAAITGVLGGAIVNTLDHENDGIKKTTEINAEPTESKDDDKCCCHTPPPRSKFYEAMHHGFVVLPSDLRGSLLIGLIIAGLIGVFVPTSYFAETFMAGGLLAMIVMMLIGIPTYVCASASVPMALAFLAKGISPGAVLVFLITGPVSNAATIVTIWKIMGRSTTLVYLLVSAITALAAGLLLDLIFNLGNISITSQIATQTMLPDEIKTIASIILISILVMPNATQVIKKYRS
jgi:uncharacterized protein